MSQEIAFEFAVGQRDDVVAAGAEGEGSGAEFPFRHQHALGTPGPGLVAVDPDGEAFRPLPWGRAAPGLAFDQVGGAGAEVALLGRNEVDFVCRPGLLALDAVTQQLERVADALLEGLAAILGSRRGGRVEILGRADSLAVIDREVSRIGPVPALQVGVDGLVILSHDAAGLAVGASRRSVKRRPGQKWTVRGLSLGSRPRPLAKVASAWRGQEIGESAKRRAAAGAAASCHARGLGVGQGLQGSPDAGQTMDVLAAEIADQKGDVGSGAAISPPKSVKAGTSIENDGLVAGLAEFDGSFGEGDSRLRCDGEGASQYAGKGRRGRSLIAVGDGM